ncbi:hypothetical protein [Leptospira borgpetersenii]|uniref:hypothetical protein n=1 Tax=Leptospira borgpetersenii TaxID=174 RepID=UPI002020AF8C|nr:hypothetical protein [Leptospira borgpetersenii]URD69211.1 hypothetical protein LIX26_10995 [Leptospira borgpetersenii]UVD72387.1 hypothetical protein NU962_11065 [Leptospira borgpetersenii]UVD75577.1 hypothetical protein LIX27_11110 [Leptospira borgpetersenii]UZW32136.1 hypothetical protein OR565_11125 [Leptospira borgpetersenii]
MQLPRFPKSDLTLSKMARSTSRFWNRFLFFFSDNLKKYPRTFGIRLVFLGLFFCKPSQIPIENNPYHQLFTNHPITRAERYSLSKSWEYRISGLNSDEQNFIQEMNQIDGLLDPPLTEIDLEFWKNRIRVVRKSLPNSVNTLLDHTLFRVILCRNLGSTGLSSFVYDGSTPLGGVIFLDTGMLTQTANEWITKKENSPFSPGNIQINVRIESDARNRIPEAIEYILLHEVGHIVSVQKGIVPDFREKYRNFNTFEFSKGIWEVENVSSWDLSFPLRKEIKFYSSKPINLENNWKKIYPVLENTPFPTLYSATNGDDFFADSFVSYIHTELQNKIWTLEILQDRKKIYEMKNGIQKPRCKKQKDFLDRLFQSYVEPQSHVF